MEVITQLTGLYSVQCVIRQKAIEKLNGLQDSREGYFSLKMQKLMSEPFIIRCFEHQKDGSDSKKMEL